MRILIVEDEQQTARMLQEVILQLQPQSQIIAVLDSIESVTRFLSDITVQPDLIFMDIQLADGISFEIFSRVQVQSPVIFCTAYDQYSMQAFKANGIEYLLKPVKVEDVQAAFNKLETLAKSFKPETEMMELLKNAITQKKSYRQSLLVQYRDGFIPLNVNDVAVFFVENEILYAYTFGQQKYPLFKPISEIESELNPKDFFRISRQALINKQAVKEIQPYFNRKVSIKTSVKLSETLVVSRLKVTEFMNWMEK
jgi:two-component system, LytTR family, response regulator LytT